MEKLINQLIIVVLFPILFSGCSNEEEVVPSTLNQDNTELIHTPDIPENLRALHNLTIFPVDTNPLYTIQLEHEVSFGDPDEVILGRTGEVAVDKTGRVFLVDHDNLTVHVFDPEGNYLANIGRRGDGPAEFRSINRLLFHNEQLYVYDIRQRRINTFSLETFEYRNTILFLPDNDGRTGQPGGTFPIRPLSVRADGSFLVYFLQVRGHYFEPDDPEIDAYHHFYIVSEDGRAYNEKLFDQAYSILIPISDNFWLPKQVPFDWMPFFAVSGDGHIFSAETEDFFIKVYDSNGNYLRSFFHPFDHKELTREKAFKISDERFHRMLRNINLPETWPALESMVIDDENRLWVSTIVDDDEVYEWWVLRDSGELITTFTWPRNQPIEVVKNGYLYTRETDEMGVVTIVRYGIEVEEIGSDN